MLRLRALILSLLLVLMMVELSFHERAIQKNPWLELEKGLKVCGVEIDTYQSCCFLGEPEQQRIVSIGKFTSEPDPGKTPDCWYSIKEGYKNGEVLLQICGSDRVACGRLWNQFKEMVSCHGGTVARSWSVEAYQDGSHDLTALGKELVYALGGRVCQVNAYPRMVQVLAYLPWAEEGIKLDHGLTNLNLELYKDSYFKKIRIRLGIPVLISL